ncbi:Replication factor A protein 1, partial [Choanephora cucurbitarum]
NLLDQTGEIKATAFGDQVTRLYHVLEEGKVYYISKARVTMARKQFSNLNNEYELGLEPNTEIEACPEPGNIPMMNFDFVKIGDLVKREANSYVDVLGVVTEDAGLSEIISKATGKPTKKRDLTIADDSGKSVRLTLWDPKDDGFETSANPIIACKGARVSDFNGRALSASSGCLIKVNPDIPEMQKLRRWYNEKGQNSQFDSFSNAMTVGGNGEYRGNSNRITLQEAKTQNLGSSDRPDYFSFRGTVVFIKNENFAYPSCPTCRKKTLLEETGWRCEKCQKSFPKPEYRYILTMSVEDATSQIYLNGFDDLGLAVLKTSANDLMELKETNGTAAHQIIAKAHYQTFNFKVRAKQEVFNDIARTKFQCVDVQPIDYVKESQELAAAIDQILE